MRKFSRWLTVLVLFTALFSSCDLITSLTGKDDEGSGKPKRVTLTVVSEGNGSVSPASGKFDKNESVTVTATPAAGYSFSTWKNKSGQVVNTDATYTFKITENTELSAAFIAIPCTLSIKAEGGGTVSVTVGTEAASSPATAYSRDLAKGTPFTVTPTPDAGKKFLGWSGDATGSDSPLIVSALDANMAITAVFVDSGVPTRNVSIIVSPANSGSVSPKGGQYLTTSAITLTATAAATYEFTSWTGTLTGTDPTLSIPAGTSDVTVTANFRKMHSIVVMNPAITVTPAKALYKTGETVTISVTEEPGYRFLGWTGGAVTGTAASVSYTVGTSDVTVGATIVERWLMLIHFAVDNNIDYTFEKNSGILTNYLATLEAVEANDVRDIMDIAVFMDSYDKTDPDGEGYTTTFTDGYYLLTGGSFADDLERNTGEVNSGSPAATKAFMDWATSASASRRTLYSVFNHGSGFDDPNATATYGIGFDSSSDSDALSHRELGETTGYLKGLRGRKIDVLYPYACLMGGVELAWEVRDNADILLCSEEVFPAEKWSYEALRTLADAPDSEPVELASAFLDSAQTYFTVTKPRDFTLSAIDLSKMGSLYTAIDAAGYMLEAYARSPLASNSQDLDEIAQNALYMQTPYYTDLDCIMSSMAQYFGDKSLSSNRTLCLNVRTALDEAVIATANRGYAACGGLTIFHNIWLARAYGYTYDPSLYASILTFGATNDWGTYMATMDSKYVAPAFASPDAYEPDNSAATTTNILGIGAANEQYHTFATASGATDVDYVKIPMTAGKTYEITTSSAEQSVDTIIYLYDTNGTTEIDSDDDGGSGLYSLLSYTPSVTGTYFLRVEELDGDAGDYNLMYQETTSGLSRPTILGFSDKWSLELQKRREADDR